MVCVCFQVGARRIEVAAAAGNGSVEKIGRQLGAGTNCGSCIPEIRRLIAIPSPRLRGEGEGEGQRQTPTYSTLSPTMLTASLEKRA